jgi:hypothetical protein
MFLTTSILTNVYWMQRISICSNFPVLLKLLFLDWFSSFLPVYCVTKHFGRKKKCRNFNSVIFSQLTRNFEVAATGFIASIATMHHVLAKTPEITTAMLNNFKPSFQYDTASQFRRRFQYVGDVADPMFPISTFPHLIPLTLVRVCKNCSVPIRVFLI